MLFYLRKVISISSRKILSSQLKEESSFSLKKLIVDDSPYQKYGLAAAGGTVVSFASILLLAVVGLVQVLPPQVFLQNLLALDLSQA